MLDITRSSLNAFEVQCLFIYYFPTRPVSPFALKKVEKILLLVSSQQINNIYLIFIDL